MITPIQYEAPAIVERTRVGQPLVLTASGLPESAVFRAEVDYEAPAIVERTPVDMPLIGAAASGPVCAAFRPEVIHAGR